MVAEDGRVGAKCVGIDKSKCRQDLILGDNLFLVLFKQLVHPMRSTRSLGGIGVGRARRELVEKGSKVGLKETDVTMVCYLWAYIVVLEVE